MGKKINLDRFLRIRKELYLQIKSQIASRLGKDSKALSKYKSEFEKDFNKKWHPSHFVKLFQQLHKAQVILMADFHGNHQSQKTHLRVLRVFLKKNPKAKIALALECLDQKYQKILDQFLANIITEETFLQKVKWHEIWGFPWESYKPIFVWAKEAGVPIIALNDSSKSHLRQRDILAAKLINQNINNDFQHIFVIYGEWHLALSHLPLQLKKHYRGASSMALVRIFQNNEREYFRNKKSLQNGVLSRKKFDFCIQNIAPWVKWQNYLVFLEGGGLVPLSRDSVYNQNENELDDDFEDSSSDYVDYWNLYLKLLCKDLRFKLPSVGDVHFYGLGDEQFWKEIKKAYSKTEVALIELLIENEKSFYLPNTKIAYISKPSVNQMASLASEYIQANLSGRHFDFIKTHSDFIKLIWINAISYFGSKLVNPKRKSDSLSDLRAAFIRKESDKIKQLSLKIALKQKMLEFSGIKMGAQAELQINNRELFPHYLAASMLGNMLGEKMFFNYLNGAIKIEEIHKWFALKMNAEFNDKYFSIVKKMEGLPHPFKSKFEEL